MTDKPIIFTAPEVRTILDGKKSQTRRVIKPQPQEWVKEFLFNCDTLWEAWGEENDKGQFPTSDIECPYGLGDRLWVRETWSYYEDAELFDCIRYKADGERRKPKFDDFPDVSENVWYQFEMMCDGYGCADHRWRSPVCMPRWASRITLEVTGVRVEQLQEISEADAIAEGCPPLLFEDTWQGYLETDSGLLPGSGGLYSQPPPSWMVNPVRCDMSVCNVTAAQRFRELWDSINKQTHPWESNPWVWVYEFRRVET